MGNMEKAKVGSFAKDNCMLSLVFLGYGSRWREAMTELENLRTENEELKARNSDLEAKEKARLETAIKRGWWLTRFLTRLSMGRNFETRARTALSSWSVWRPGKDIPREETINMFAAYL